MKTMKPKNFAMITEDKVTEIFCIADDFCKVFDAQMAKYTFKAERKRKYHRESRMSKAEIMVIMILFHSSGYRCLKHFYLEKVCKHMRHLFPEVVSYNRWSCESRVKLAWLCRVQPIYNEVNRNRVRR